MHNPVEGLEPVDILGQQVVLNDPAVRGLVMTDDSEGRVFQHLRLMDRFPVAHIPRTRAFDDGSRYTEANATIHTPRSVLVPFCIIVLGDQLVAKEVRRLCARMRHERFGLGEFEFECCLKQLAKCAFDFLGFCFRSREPQEKVVRIAYIP